MSEKKTPVPSLLDGRLTGLRRLKPPETADELTLTSLRMARCEPSTPENGLTRRGSRIPYGCSLVCEGRRMDWLNYVIAFLILLGALAVLGWSLKRQARGKAGCGSGCCTCSFFREADGCDGPGHAGEPTSNATPPPA